MTSNIPMIANPRPPNRNLPSLHARMAATVLIVQQPRATPIREPREDAKKIMQRQTVAVKPESNRIRQPDCRNFHTIAQKYPAAKKPKRLGWKLKGESLSRVSIECKRLEKPASTKRAMHNTPDQKNASSTWSMGTSAIYSLERRRTAPITNEASIEISEPEAREIATMSTAIRITNKSPSPSNKSAIDSAAESDAKRLRTTIVAKRRIGTSCTRLLMESSI